ncbi:crystal protein [Diaporthe amygdali]|uniref:crystal protein n=1 Tax=Phomopsis amygdali TaxID=1214568 RepID=UPI0022FDC9B0|nr:crystal protein [Diaporthe amygdali]KAJ0116365.1 crystal protein [Diaporthe amygdali]
MSLRSLLRVFALLAPLTASTPSPDSLNSDLTILLDNNLQGASSPTADSGVIVLSPRAYQDAVSGCQELSEELWSPALGTANIQANLDYFVYEGKAQKNSSFWIAAQSNQTRALSASGQVTAVDPSQKLNVLCTQTAPFANSSSTDTSAEWQVSVHSNNEDLIGFRDRTAFRFYGIRYAPQPERFTYSVPYTGSNTSVSATTFGSECAQGTAGSEDCLFLNIWTPYLPSQDSKSDKSALKPVMFWIHGGAFTGGSANDPTFDGGSVASRGDVVLVAINYRLSTLGFLALDDGVTNGNFGLADQINALDWVRANIQDFGGDPDRVTLIGQSAGAGSVRAIMASPEAEGKFAGAIPMSNLGGLNYGTTYSEYYTIEEEVNVAANAILAATNCTEAESQVDCLRAIPANTLTSLSTVARYVVVDGTYITTQNLTLTGPEAPYKLMMGVMREDGAPFVPYPTTTNETEYLTANGWNIPQSTLDELFPLPAGANQTLNLYNVTSRIATDGIFRCADEATVFSGLESGKYSSVYYYEFERSYQTSGYPGIDVCQPPITADHPYGDPSLPYLRCHSGELYYVFGNVAFEGLPERDDNDLPFEQFALDSFTSFVRTYDPNPDRAFLEARHYTNTSMELDRTGSWRPATQGNLTLRALTWGSYQDSFRESQQCEALGVPLTYWE